MMRRPSQANSRFSTTDVTVGLKDVCLLPGGWIVTLSFSPGTREPEMEVMNGSHEECPGKSVRIAQTRSGLALISTVELTVFIACSFQQCSRPVLVLGPGRASTGWTWPSLRAAPWRPKHCHNGASLCCREVQGMMVGTRPPSTL